MGKSDAARRILILGNSITFHAQKEEIGWYANWGMAASCEAHDYVHLLLRKLESQDCCLHVAQLADWEYGINEEKRRVLP